MKGEPALNATLDFLGLSEVGLPGVLAASGSVEARVQMSGRILSQDTYWCHTVSVFTAFSPNRIGEYDTYCRIYCSTSCSTS